MNKSPEKENVGKSDRLFAEGVAHHQAGRWAEAEACYANVVALTPTHAEAWLRSGAIHFQIGQIRAAIARYLQALRLKPAFPVALNKLGDALKAEGNIAAAIHAYQQAIALEPNYLQAISGLGITLAEQGKTVEAIPWFEKAVRIWPDNPEVRNNLALSLQAIGETGEAIQQYRFVLERTPHHLLTLQNLGNALLELGQPVEALSRFEQALQLDPNSSSALGGRASALTDLGRVKEANHCYDLALQLKPEDAALNNNASRARLLIGDFERGWREFEYRWRAWGLQASYEHKKWDGGPLENKTILLQCEQGLGDSIQFIRYARLIKDKGANVIVFCQKQLLRLFRTVDGIDLLITETSETPTYDCQAFLLSLPWMLGTTLTSIPARTPYLQAEPALATRWKNRMESLPGLKVGLVWSGDPNKQKHGAGAVATEQRRSMRLEQLSPLALVPGLCLISLQKGEAAQQARHPPPGLTLFDWTEHLTDFADTAALIANLDLVISVDTSVAHLAGALGRPVWVLSRFDGCWRWLMERDDSPWYPTLTLFRQPAPHDWSSVVNRVVARLKTLV